MLITSLARQAVSIRQGFPHSILKSTRFPPIFPSRLLHFGKSKEEKLKFVENKYQFLKDYDCVYRFKHINILTTLSRLKFYQSMLTFITGVTTTTLFLTTASITTKSLIIINLATVSALVTLLLFSKVFINVICAMYLHKDGAQVLISHINFFARRRNIITTVNNIKPLVNSYADLSESTYLKFQLNDSDGTMYYSVRHSNVLDKKKLLKILRVD